MKRIIFLLLCILLVTSCGKTKTIDEKMSDLITSQKETYILNAKNYISAVRAKVTSLDYNFIKEDKFYLINVNPDDNSCISLENDGFSPFGNFIYAYVGVDYNGLNYTYYWLAKDSGGYGTNTIIKEDELNFKKIISNVVTAKPKTNDILLNNKPTIIINKTSTIKC